MIKVNLLKPHRCGGKLPSDGYGEAVTFCVELNNGELWVGNKLIVSQVNYCPYCGKEALIKVGE